MDRQKNYYSIRKKLRKYFDISSACDGKIHLERTIIIGKKYEAVIAAQHIQILFLCYRNWNHIYNYYI